MYDEFERALTGKAGRKGLSPLGWIAAAAGVVMLVGVVGIGYAVTRAAEHARHMVRELAATPGLAASRLATRLEGSASVATLDPDAGLSFLRGLGPGDPSQAFVQELVGADLDPISASRQVTDKARSGDDVSSLTIDSDDGDVHVGLSRNEDGGSLVVDSKDGHVRFDLVKSEKGGTLTIDSDDGHARVDLIGSDDGGQILIRSDQGKVALGIGSSSREAPGWVPRPEGMPESAHPVLSLSSEESVLGAVAWEDDASPGELLGSFQGALEGEGYEVQAEHRRTGPDRDEASLWARNEASGRTVFLVSRRVDGRTHELLGYGQGDGTH